MAGVSKMSTRVIDNPELIGWELDPNTGRWMWTGGSGSGGGGIEEAPVDSLIYGRQNAAWTEVVAGSNLTYTLPVSLRSGDAQLPLTLDGAKLAVMTRGGELELPLAA